jgi:serine/threonine-protein kinase RIM15
MADGNELLAPPAVKQLRSQAGGEMERSLSQDIREEREDLREAAEQTLNVIMDLGLNGVVRWVSPSWTDVIGTALESIQGKAIQDILLGEEKDVFTKVIGSMKQDDSRSQIIRFRVPLGPASKLFPLGDPEQLKTDEAKVAETEPQAIDLEGQGIMVYDRSSGGESHVCLTVITNCILLTFRRQCG